MSNGYRLNVLPVEAGRTYMESGYVIINESFETFRRLMSQQDDTLNALEKQRKSELELLIAHENIHYIQSFTCGYLLHRTYRLHNLFAEINAFAKSGRSIRPQLTEFNKIQSEIIQVKDGLSPLSLIEGVAFLEAFKSCFTNLSILQWEKYLIDYFSDQSLADTYTKAFTILKEKVGVGIALKLFAPLSFISLNTEDPVGTYFTLLDKISEVTLENLIHLNFSQLTALLGYSFEDHVVVGDNFKTSSAAVQPILFDIIYITSRKMPAEKILEIAATPSKLTRLATPDERSLLMPPLITFSKSPSEKYKAMQNGILNHSRRPEKTVDEIITFTALFGAVERMANNKSTPYNFCPNTGCSHYTANYCSKYYAAPSLELGHENCRFPDKFQKYFDTLPVNFKII